MAGFVRCLFVFTDNSFPRCRTWTERNRGLSVPMSGARLRPDRGEFEVVDRLLPWLRAADLARLLCVLIATHSRTRKPASRQE